ncbi:MAG: TetR family transcriptional regulator [Rubrivivax sp.]|jgi:TetR/AcrR family acrAB operon transcriptional repressor
MARKTKEEAQATRSAILDAAEALFQARGVSSTSLQDIAAAAGVTRGAIYWHFQDKGDVFNAMMDRACTPLAQAIDDILTGHQGSPVATVRAKMALLLQSVERDANTRRVFEIATRKVEYVDDLAAVREQQTQLRDQYIAKMAELLREAQAAGEVDPACDALELAFALHALVDGLMQNWLITPDALSLQRVGNRAIAHYLAGLRPGAAPP